MGSLMFLYVSREVRECERIMCHESLFTLIDRIRSPFAVFDRYILLLLSRLSKKG